MSDYGFSVSVGNIIESSGAGSGAPATIPVTIKKVKREKPGQSSKTTRKKISKEKIQTVKTTHLEGDGYGWRKYGQKIIHNQLYPKSYYRCTHHEDEKCEAKKWIQQESENPPIYKTTYLGHHTCKNPLKIPQIFFSDYSSLSSPTSPYDFIESSVSQPFVLHFNSPESSHFISHHVEKAQEVTEEMAPIEIVDSTMFPCYEAYENNEYFPPIPSPNSTFESLDFDMMMQEYYLLGLDNVSLMEDY